MIETSLISANRPLAPRTSQGHGKTRRPPALSPYHDSHGKSSFQGSWGKEDGEQTALGVSVRVMRTPGPAS